MGSEVLVMAEFCQSKQSGDVEIFDNTQIFSTIPNFCNAFKLEIFNLANSLFLKHLGIFTEKQL